MRPHPVPVLLIFTIALPALAGNGVLEINQTCAVTTGCFAGDAPGLPVTISTGGSYELTSNLVVPDENSDGIVVGTLNVSIDLAGFEIRGPVICSGTPLICTPSSGTGSGVEVTFNFISGTSVRSGSILGMGNGGVVLGPQSEVMNVRARSNRLGGISVGSGSVVSGNAVHQNGEGGIFATNGSTLSGNSATSNGGTGLLATSNTTVLGNSAFGNFGDGVRVLAGSTVSSNTAGSNTGIGISAGDGSSVTGNTVRQNTGFGLSLGAQSGYRENVISSNGAGTVTGAGFANLGNNACNGSTTCP